MLSDIEKARDTARDKAKRKWHNNLLQKKVKESRGEVAQQAAKETQDRPPELTDVIEPKKLEPTQLLDLNLSSKRTLGP
jgi:hypothetical protein